RRITRYASSVVCLDFFICRPDLHQFIYSFTSQFPRIIMSGEMLLPLRLIQTHCTGHTDVQRSNDANLGNDEVSISKRANLITHIRMCIAEHECRSLAQIERVYTYSIMT